MFFKIFRSLFSAILMPNFEMMFCTSEHASAHISHVLQSKHSYCLKQKHTRATCHLDHSKQTGSSNQATGHTWDTCLAKHHNSDSGEDDMHTITLRLLRFTSMPFKYALSTLGKARLPTWTLASTVRFSNLTSTVTNSMPALVHDTCTRSRSGEVQQHVEIDISSTGGARC